jgi:hypothetical protein
MPPLRDADTVAKFRISFEERTSGAVSWKRVPAEWVRKNLDGLTQEAINCLILQHIQDGQEIDQVIETREGYRERYQYHYDFRIIVSGKLVYIETVLDETKMGPIVTVVNIHYA